MNALAAEWRPDGLENLDDNSKLPDTFHKFSSLDDDLATLTLSFVSDVPFELDQTNYRSYLTHIIPLVSKHFHGLVSRNDFLWRNGLARLVKKEPYVWRAGVKKLIASAGEHVIHARDSNNGRERLEVGATNGRERVFVIAEHPERVASSDNEGGGNTADDEQETTDRETPTGPSAQATIPEPTNAKLIDDACKCLSVDGIPSNCQRLFREVVSKYIRFTGPIFCESSKRIELRIDFRGENDTTC